jgi:putative DNA primase/helicase
MEKLQNEAIKNRLYLAVDYDDRAEAKGLGAQFDSSAKSWYIDSSKLGQADFSKWIVKAAAEAVGLGKSTPEEDFTAFLKSEGVLITEAAVMDGKNHYVKMEGNKGSRKSGVYRAYNDENPQGFVMDYREGEPVKWRFSAKKRSLPERRAIEANSYVRSLRRADETLALRVGVAADSASFYAALPFSEKENEYLVSKGVVTPQNARSVPKGFFCKKDTLVLPIVDLDRKIWSLQTIGASGFKMLKKDGLKEGNMIEVQGDYQSSKMVIVAEGYSTALSIAQSIKIPVIAAIDAHNLDPVVRGIMHRHPELKVLVAGDDDHTLELDARGRVKKNVGVDQAIIAGASAGIPPIFPLQSENRAKADFNDMFVAQGPASVKNHFNGHIDKHIIPLIDAADNTKAASSKETEPTQSAAKKGSRVSRTQAQAL